MHQLPRSIEQRYREDNEFHYLVDMLCSLISRAKYTPTEIREAALLAMIHYERQIIVDRDMYERMVISDTTSF